jgi:hypothetical protein
MTVLRHRSHGKKKSFIHPLVTSIHTYIHTHLRLARLESLAFSISVLYNSVLPNHSAYRPQIMLQATTNSWCVLKLQGGCLLSPRTSLTGSHKLRLSSYNRKIYIYSNFTNQLRQSKSYARMYKRCTKCLTITNILFCSFVTNTHALTQTVLFHGYTR